MASDDRQEDSNSNRSYYNQYAGESVWRGTEQRPAIPALLPANTVCAKPDELLSRQ